MDTQIAPDISSIQEKPAKKKSSLTNAKITDFWKPPDIELDSSVGDEDELDKSRVAVIENSNKSPCFDLTNKDNGKESKRDPRESGEEDTDENKAELFQKKKKRKSESGPVKKMKIEDNGNDSMEQERTEPKGVTSSKSPRKSQRNAPARSYKELDKYLYEEKKTSKVKNRSLEKFREFFKKATERTVGRPPKEPKAPVLSSPSSEKVPSVSRAQIERRSLPGPNVTPKRRGRPPATDEEKEAKKAEYKKKLSEKLKEKRRLEREAKEKSKALHDDLLLDNLKPLPKLTPVECLIPTEGLGDFFCILEFFSAYSQELSVKDYFPQGVTFDILERAFTEVDAMGLLVFVVQILLGSLVKLEQKDWTVDYSVRNDADDAESELAVLQEKAAITGAEFRETFGYMFHYAPLDSFTFSDVLRYHFKASGAPGIDLRDRIHCHQGFTPKEDPGLIFVRDNPKIMEKLDSSCVSNLDVLEKIKIVKCLIDQVLTFELFRDTIEEGLEGCVELKVQLKKLHWRKKMLDDEEKGIKREAEEVNNEEEKKRKNWRYVLPDMPREEIDKQIETTERDIDALWYRFGLSSLGEDRSHRLYSILHSIPAIVVETVPTIEAPCMIGGTPPKRTDGDDGEEMDEDQETSVETEPQLICTGSKSTCTIHGRQTISFEFVSSVEQLDALYGALASKGMRESTLKETVGGELEFLRKILKKTPITKLNQSLTDTTRRKYQSESFKPSNVAGLQPDLALGLTFRELLLDIEEKAVQGSLGGFREDKQLRSKWRTDLEAPLLQMQTQSPEETNRTLLDTHTGAEEVSRMAEKLLEFSETIPSKFLKAPLGEQGVTLRNKLDNWRAALPGCLNFSQLFLFYSSLENSVQWQKGLTNARCAICRGKATPDRMVRCETCDCVFHLSCCKPALRETPASPWFCRGCAPDNVPDSPRKKPRVLAEDAEDSMSEMPDNNDYCEVCLKDEKLHSCDYCPRSFHLGCIDLKRAPRGEWQCFACAVGTKKYKLKLKELRKNLEVQAEFLNEPEVDEWSLQNQCQKCGELLSRGHIECLGCSRKYHLACADLPKRPKNDWYCKKRCEPGYVEPSLNQFPEESSGDEMEEQPEVVSETDGKPQSASDVFDTAACTDILEVLRKSDHAWPFLEPVSRKDAPDYFKIIKKPMDLSTIHTKLDGSKYTKNSTFINDIMQIFKNCEEYNTEEAEVYKEGKRLLELFVSLIENYSMQSFLVTGQFKWLDDYMNNRCTKCEVPFSGSSKTVSCAVCRSPYHPRCAALKVIPVKWECSKCSELDEVEREQLQQPAPVAKDHSKDVDVTGFDFKECSDIVEMLLKDFLSVPFRRPVTKKDAPDYFEIIETPIDLATIKHSLNHMKYNSNQKFIDDLVLMFDNCERYNSEKSSIYSDAHRLWEKLVKRFEDSGFIALLDKSKAPKWVLSRTRR